MGSLAREHEGQSRWKSHSHPYRQERNKVLAASALRPLQADAVLAAVGRRVQSAGGFSRHTAVQGAPRGRQLAPTWAYGSCEPMEPHSRVPLH